MQEFLEVLIGVQRDTGEKGTTWLAPVKCTILLDFALGMAGIEPVNMLLSTWNSQSLDSCATLVSKEDAPNHTWTLTDCFKIVLASCNPWRPHGSGGSDLRSIAHNIIG